MAKALRSTRVVTSDGFTPATVVVEEERIAAVQPLNEASGDAELHDFGGLAILPGLVDTHVHINEAGRTEWERFSTATRAAAAGGVTTLVDMPLNCVPETIAAMLFIRSPGGVSHHRDEDVCEEDVEIAVQAGLKFVERLAADFR